MFPGVNVDEGRRHTEQDDQKVGHTQVHKEEVGRVPHVGIPTHHENHQKVADYADRENEQVEKRGGDDDIHGWFGCCHGRPAQTSGDQRSVVERFVH